MDQVKIGKFIAAMRKKQGLSQKQLAERIDVTDKTISKWETGNRMPDASLLLKLSFELQINVNELLAGERFSQEEPSPEEYVKKSESNIVNLVGELNENEKRRKGKGIGTAAGALLMALAFIQLVGSSLPLGKLADIFDMPTLFYLSGLKFLIISISGRFHDYLNAWRICLPGTDLSVKEMGLSIDAVKYAGALSLTLGGITSSIGLFSLFNYMTDLDRAGSGIAQVVLSLFYTAVIETVYVILLFYIRRALSDKEPMDS